MKKEEENKISDAVVLKPKTIQKMFICVLRSGIEEPYTEIQEIYGICKEFNYEIRTSCCTTFTKRLEIILHQYLLVMKMTKWKKHVSWSLITA